MNVENKIVRARMIAVRLQKEANGAVLAWTNWLALNERLGNNSKFGRAIDHLNLAAIGPIRLALARDALITTFRITDPPGSASDLLTLCHLAKILGQNDLKGFLSGKDWPPQLGYSVELVADAAERNTKKLEFILDYIPAKWDSKNPPRKSAIFDFRNKYKAMRDGILAHIKDDGAVAHPLVDEITEYVRLSHELVMAAAFILDGSSLATGDVYSLAEKSARKFWSYAEVGAIQAHHVDSERLRTY